MTSERDSNNAIAHAIAEWEGVNAGPAHGVLVRAAREALAARRVETSDAQRVRTVVREATIASIIDSALFYTWSQLTEASHRKLIDAIAGRVAAQLGLVDLSADEREALAILRGDLQFTTSTHAVVVRSILDRLLGATP